MFSTDSMRRAINIVFGADPVKKEVNIALYAGLVNEKDNKYSI